MWAQLLHFSFCKTTSLVASNDGSNTRTENKASCKGHRWGFQHKPWSGKGNLMSRATVTFQVKTKCCPFWEGKALVSSRGLGGCLWRIVPNFPSSFNWSQRTPHEATGVTFVGTGATGIWVTCSCNSPDFCSNHLVCITSTWWGASGMPNLWLHCMETLQLMAKYLVLTMGQWNQKLLSQKK